MTVHGRIDRGALPGGRAWVAFLFGTLLTVLVYPPACYLLNLLLSWPTLDVSIDVERPPELLALALFAFGLGLFLAFNQSVVLRACLKRRAGWLVASGLAMMLFVPGVMLLVLRVAFLPPPALDFHSLAAPATRQLESAATAWGWLGGAASGLAGGLLFGLVQSLFLPGRRRLWWLLNGAAWAILCGAILAFLNVTNLIFSWGHWE
jgi:hypothetical protein